MVFLWLAAIPGIADQPDILARHSLVREKPDRVISDRANKWFQNQPGDEVKAWIYFTDKGTFDQGGFQKAADKISFNEHVLNRRARIGRSDVTFADLPAYRPYIDRIVAAGAELKRISRWLNAASFMVEKENLDRLANLPFVHKIEPVIKYKKAIPIDLPVDKDGLKQPEFAPAETDVLDYGESYNQMVMIGAVTMHQQAYNGQGVIVAMFDTGYRKTHSTFDLAYGEGRVLAEYDFINDDGDTQNETGDPSTQHNHGTYTWSTLGGYSPGQLIGPAYEAQFILAKTEDVADEYQGEEDNWIAALEWADSIGADVVSTSLSYYDWYTYEDLDGNTAPITLAANTAADLGIIVCNSISNRGPAAGTLGAPADAFDILACGAVDEGGTITSFSSRGPTFDGRTKPEVCAQGLSTRCAHATGDNDFTYKSGTSLSTPLIGGAAAVLLSANPTLTPRQLRRALMETANRAHMPDNTYGWGIINLWSAYNWGANFTADTTYGDGNLTVHFYDSSISTAYTWKWYFGDGDSADIQNPVHTYTMEGTYDVTLTIESDIGSLTRTKEDFIVIGSWDGLRGDANNDGVVNIVDISFLISFLYTGGPAPVALMAGDANSDNLINILDVTFLINYLYLGGPPPWE